MILTGRIRIRTPSFLTLTRSTRVGVVGLRLLERNRPSYHCIFVQHDVFHARYHGSHGLQALPRTQVLQRREPVATPRKGKRQDRLVHILGSARGLSMRTWYESDIGDTLKALWYTKPPYSVSITIRGSNRGRRGRTSAPFKVMLDSPFLERRSRLMKLLPPGLHRGSHRSGDVLPEY